MLAVGHETSFFVETCIFKYRINAAIHWNIWNISKIS